MAQVLLEKVAILPAAAALSIAVSACGGGSSHSSRTPSSTTSASPLVGETSTAPASISSGPIHASLQAPNHSPIVGKDWPYSVHVTDASGRPLSGTVDIEFTFGGNVVGRDTPPAHPIRNGLWHDTLTFPRASLGYPLTFQAVVHTKLGTVTLGWPVTTRQ